MTQFVVLFKFCLKQNQFFQSIVQWFSTEACAVSVGPWKNFCGTWRFKKLRTDLNGKIQNKNRIVHNQTDLVDISSWFTYFRVSQTGASDFLGGHEQNPLLKTFFLVFTSLFGQKRRNRRQFQSDDLIFTSFLDNIPSRRPTVLRVSGKKQRTMKS